MDKKIKEALRYLGYKGNIDDEQIINLAQKLMSELEKACKPRYTYKVFDIAINNSVIDFGSFNVASKNLSKNLKDCTKCVIFAATLGTEADFLIRRYSKISITNSVIINACASALIEEYCDKFQKEIEQNIIGYLRPRFSPGYGDFNLEHQTDLVSAINTSKSIGLTLSDTLILMPTKSVTAVIGISQTNNNCILSGCEVCQNKTCQYKRG